MCLLKNVFDAVSKDQSGTIGRVYVKYRSGERHWYKSVSTFSLAIDVILNGVR